MGWSDYARIDGYDELVDASGRPRRAARTVLRRLDQLGIEDRRIRQLASELAIKAMGVTFTVYHERDGAIDRAWPLDIVPRTIPLSEWTRIEAGLAQRVRALNHFIDDVYGAQRIVAAGVFPGELLASSKNFREECRGVRPAHGVWAHVCGTDLVRDRDGTVYVLEDNLRVPSGVSYMIENREVIKRVFPELFERTRILPVDDYPQQLYDTLAAVSPRQVAQPEVVVLTPGIYNSAYFEHAYLAQQMGCELVEGRDLRVGDDDVVRMRTVRGWQRVDVIYRRIDDEFMDPECFRPDSALGVPGLMRAWRKGKVALANAPGAGVADDKLVYTYVPDMIRYYLGEEAILPNVPTWRCSDPTQLAEVLPRLAELVIKPVDASGGYGILIGPQSTKAQREEFGRLLRKDPRGYVAQPTLHLSTAPVLTANGFAPRHLDLRPFILSGGERTWVTNGGLTRVAMRAGSLVVNSSQGGGSKDTWIVDTEG